jgi:hypothetical protein
MQLSVQDEPFDHHSILHALAGSIAGSTDNLNALWHR